MAFRGRLATGALIAVPGTGATGLPAAASSPAVAAAPQAVRAAPAPAPAPAPAMAPATTAGGDLAGWMGGLKAVLGDRPRPGS
ncbi:hypothetical protein ACFXGI_31890 [Streptomyces sp. NPDC059355]|uniref:hypothetical protein n=1 Tax=Streptomyces sp. NPDC059355 TaxID=3346811 RepID=UPI0036C37000